MDYLHQDQLDKVPPQQIIRKEVRLKVLLEISDLMSFSEGMTPKGYPYDSDSSTQDSFTVSPHQMGIFI